jgi:hypothetical protein
MDVHTFFGYVACILSVASMAPYVRSIVLRETTLSRIGWFIWAIVTSVLFFANTKTGSQFSVFMSFIGTVNLWIIFLLSFWYGGDRAYWWHYVALLLALAALGLYAFAGSEYGLLATIIIADAIGGVIFIEKAWRAPKSENWSGWMMYFLATACNLLALRGASEWYSVKLAYPLYCFIVSGLVIVPITRYRWRSIQGENGVSSP